MAKVDDSFTSYDAQANREDLSDIIYNIDPFDTPMMTAGGRRNVSNVLFDWQTEELPALDTGADVEGFELDREAGQATVRLNNSAQIKHRDATVTRTQQKANPAGKKNEMSHQIALKGKALKRECEKVLFGVRQAQNTGNNTTARTTRSLINWIETNTVYNTSDGVDPVVSSNTQVTDGTQQAFTEDMLNDAMELAWNEGGEPSLAFMGSYQKRVASGFAGRTSARQMIAANKVVNSVQVYATDFGDLKLIPSRWVRTREVFLMDPRYYRVAYYDNFNRAPMGKIGDAETELITVEFGLQVDNEKAHAVIRDLSVS